MKRFSCLGFVTLICVVGRCSGKEVVPVASTAALNSGTSPAWRGRLNAENNLGYFCAFIKYNSMPNYRSVVTDPTVRGSRQPCLKVTFKAGAWSPNAAVQGGMLFHAYPYGKKVSLASMGAALEYDVYFPPGFQWQKGGKLPGMAGGLASCGGGKDPVTCWSARVMWRREGAGEAYLYVPHNAQAADFCQDNVNGTRTYCNDAAGRSLGVAEALLGPRAAFGRGAFIVHRACLAYLSPFLSSQGRPSGGEPSSSGLGPGTGSGWKSN